MKEDIQETRDEVQGIDMIDLGDAMEETRQASLFPTVPDSCCMYTYLGE
jgi:hypothetical protein